MNQKSALQHLKLEFIYWKLPILVVDTEILVVIGLIRNIPTIMIGGHINQLVNCKGVYMRDHRPLEEDVLISWNDFHGHPHHNYKKSKHKKKHEIKRLQKELDSVKEKCVELKRENMMLRNKVRRLEHEDRMNQPRRKKYPPFWGAPWYCWGSDAWR